VSESAEIRTVVEFKPGRDKTAAEVIDTVTEAFNSALIRVDAIARKADLRVDWSTVNIQTESAETYTFMEGPHSEIHVSVVAR
jgi:hypothetical protein